MKHGLLRLAAQVYNVPHLILADSLAPILDYLDARNSQGFERLEFDAESNASESKPYANGIGVLHIDGSLTYKPVMTMCGEVGTSYTRLISQMQEMAEAGVRTVVMLGDSGGGQAIRCFETAREIRSICDEHDIKLIGYVDTLACSGGYALMCVCDEVIANADATVGSIGAVIALHDTSKAYEQAGVKRIFITSGSNKVPFAEDGSFKKSFLDSLQEDINELNEDFAQHVSSFTGLSVETIKSFEADTFTGKKALELGLVNKVMTNKEFASYVATIHQGIYQ